jgi:phytoene dehydrogenase-like protein
MGENIAVLACSPESDPWFGVNENAECPLFLFFSHFVPDFRPAVIETDTFTPLTIHRFTGHSAGSVYGSARKRRDGTTHLKNLFICGNDQGPVGVVGTIISGISIANRYLLK